LPDDRRLLFAQQLPRDHQPLDLAGAFATTVVIPNPAVFWTAVRDLLLMHLPNFSPTSTSE